MKITFVTAYCSSKVFAAIFIEYRVQKVIAKINLKHLQSNARLFKEKSKTKLCAVVKANAYGHGAEEVACALSGIADCFAVALIEEGISLRAGTCEKDILVLTPPVDFAEGYALAVGGFLTTVPDLTTAKLLLAVCERYRLVGRVHLKVNTGMNRYGMDGQTLGKVCKLFQDSPYIRVEGLYSHLYTCNASLANTQRECFLRLRRVARGYFPWITCHLSATYGCLLGEEFAFDMVRVGLGLYGYAPLPTALPLQRAMSVWARVTATRNYAFGGAGYGELELKKGTPLTLLRAGYADGFLRKRENGVEGYEKNINNLCMDGCIRLDKGKKGAWAPILLDAERTAEQTGTIAYEVLCAATRRAEFIYER